MRWLRQREEVSMPLVRVTLVDDVFSTEEKHRLAAALTDVMVQFEGSEAFREVVWVLIEELHTDGWHIGGWPFEGPRSLLDTLGRSKAMVETIAGHPTSRAEFARLAPPIARDAGEAAARASSHE
jgi:4-oxalocrotonate tautomerase